MASSQHRAAIAMLTAMLMLAPALAGRGRAEEPPAQQPPSLEETVDHELLREVDEAARLEREHRAAQEAAATREQEQREAARRRAEKQRSESERSEEAAYQQRLAEQQAVQGDLLWAVSGRGKPRPEALRTRVVDPDMPDSESANPRIASAAPAERELPVEIFDSSRVEIAAGRWSNREPFKAIKRVLDGDGDGKPELVRYVDPDSGLMLRQEADRNYDGIMDAWSDYAGGEIVARVLDGNGDGNPDVWERYRAGRLSTREIDRDDDGVKDVFYRYRGDSLSQEKHDADNDGIVDLVVFYESRLRVRTEEDVDRDGRIDTWTRYVSQEGVERIARIERDQRGRGYADTFETFETVDGKAVLLRREQDVNGDGEIDVVSFYVNGKLRRRQISNASAAPG